MIELGRHLRDDDLVVIPQGTAEPLDLTRRLVAEEHLLPRVRVFLGTLFSDTFDTAERLRFVSNGGMGTARRLIAAGRCEVVPCHISSIAPLHAGPLRPGVVILHLSGESRDGRHSVGIVDDNLDAAMTHARVVIAQVNRQMPYTHGSTTVALDELDAYEFVDTPLLELPRPRLDEQSRRIGAHAAELIGDGACVQIGIGAVPGAILSELHGRRDLGIHSGLITDDLLDLHRSGAVSNAGKALHPGRSVVGCAFGTRELYDALHEDETIMFRTAAVTHGQDALARLERFVSINSAIEVDLTGQVNSEMAGDVHLGGVGGAVDYVRGATASPGGRSIIALPATDRSGKRSRIVPAVAAGVTTIARSDVDTVITEYGVAELRGLTLHARARALAAIAHPRFRDELAGAHA